MRSISAIALFAICSISSLLGQTTDEWQKRAVVKYPDLGLAGSPLNKAFVAEVAKRRQNKAGFFNSSDWPMRLADEFRGDPLALTDPDHAAQVRRLQLSDDLEQLDRKLEQVNNEIARLGATEFTSHGKGVRRYAPNHKEIEQELEPLYARHNQISQDIFSRLPENIKLQRAGPVPKETDAGGTIPTFEQFISDRFGGVRFTSWSVPRLVYREFRGTDWIGWNVTTRFVLPDVRPEIELDGLIVHGKLVAVFNKNPMLGESTWIPNAE